MQSLRAWVLAIVGAASLGACGASRSNSEPPQSEGSAQASPDGGMMLPPPPPPSKKGIIVPSDTGIGAAGEPSGIPSNTGTAGRAVGPSVGNPGGSN
jgi:hypothetical protein